MHFIVYVKLVDVLRHNVLGGKRKEWKASRQLQEVAFIPFYSLHVSASLLNITRYLIYKYVKETIG